MDVRTRRNRLLRSLRRQDWAAVAIELIVVVLGILIALQVDQWAQQKNDRELERTYLLRLKEDLAIEYADARAAEGWARDRIEAVEVLQKLASDPSAAADAPVDVPWAIETASWRSFPRVSAFAYNELQGTGQLRLLRSHALRRALADHYGRFALDAVVGEDRAAEEGFDEATAGVLTIGELTDVERAQGNRRDMAIDRSRALVMAADFAGRGEAVRRLPSMVQHHLFNLRVIGEMKARVRRLAAAVEQEIEASG